MRISIPPLGFTSIDLPGPEENPGPGKGTLRDLSCPILDREILGSSASDFLYHIHP